MDDAPRPSTTNRLFAFKVLTRMGRRVDRARGMDGILGASWNKLLTEHRRIGHKPTLFCYDLRVLSRYCKRHRDDNTKTVFFVSNRCLHDPLLSAHVHRTACMILSGANREYRVEPPLHVAGLDSFKSGPLYFHFDNPNRSAPMIYVI
ncbi:hypothetical protein ACLOJK_014027 [Asimina triloba]